MELIRIEDVNLERMETVKYPVGINSKQAKANYALSLGLDYLEANPEGKTNGKNEGLRSPNE